MRILLALVYISLGMWIYFQIGGESFPPFIGMAVGFALLFSSVIVCNEGFLRRLRGQSDDDYIEELLRTKKAKLEKYEAVKAITFEDLNTGCLCHMLEVGKEKVLCLYGQYLYEYVEIKDDPEMNQERKFPTSKFKLVRKAKNEELLRLDIGEDLLLEQKAKNVNFDKLYDLGFSLEDGQLVCGVSFEEVKMAFE